MGNHHLSWVTQQQMAISNSYVKLPEGEKAALSRDRSGTTSNAGIGITNFPVPLTSGESQVKRL